MRFSGLAYLLAAAACAALPLASPSSAWAAHPFVPGELLVRFEPQLRGEKLRGVLGSEDARIERRLAVVPGLRLVDLAPGTSVREGVAAFQEDSGILYAEPNYRRTPFAKPNDPRFSHQWALRNTGQAVFGTRGTALADVGALGAWGATTGGSAVTIAVIDTGVALSHPDLDGNLWTNPGEIPGNGIDDDGNGFVDDVHGWDFGAGDNDPTDSPGPDQGHGTEVAGVAGAEGSNGVGIAGLDWRVSLMPLRAAGSVAEEVAALGYARNEGARIVNLSGGSVQSSATEQAAIAASPGVLFVAAAGNERSNNDASPVYPCSDPAPNVVCVAATDQRDALAAFSNIGPTSVDLAAPGENILSTFPAGAQATVLREGFARGRLEASWKSGGLGRKWRSARLHDHGRSATAFLRAGQRSTDISIRSRAIDLADWRRCALLAFVKTNLQRKHGRLLVEVSRNARRWRLVGRYSGKRAGDREISLPAKATGDRSVFLRFRLRGDGSAHGGRVFVDDLQLDCRARRDTYAYNDGTSFSAPLVAGAAGLVLAAHPAFSTADLRAALLAGVDQLPGLYGKVVTAGRLDVAKAVGP